MGLGYDGGYRVRLFELAAGDNKSITFVGRSTTQNAGGPNGPSMVAGQPFPRDHEGHSGWTIQGIADRVPSPALDDDPHIVLLHIGTNDMYAVPKGDEAGPVSAPIRLGALMDKIIELQPESLLVVSTIVPLTFQMRTYVDEVDAYNEAVGAEVQARIDAGKHVLFVDQFEGFPESELGDMIHPNRAGYERMGEKWYAAIKDYLPEAE